MKICPNRKCKTSGIPDEANFCPECGRQLKLGRIDLLYTPAITAGVCLGFPSALFAGCNVGAIQIMNTCPNRKCKTSGIPNEANFCPQCGQQLKSGRIDLLYTPAITEGVDLGLPSGLKWATCNVGAKDPWDYGDYLAWGQTQDKINYSERTYNKCLIPCISLTNDAAHIKMGGSWRIPTKAEQQELVDNCYWKWTDSYMDTGVSGYIVYKAKVASDKGKRKCSGSRGTTMGSYSLSDTHIFLPTAGYRYESDLIDDGFIGGYWSSSLNTGDPSCAYSLYFDSDTVGSEDYERIGGLSVRGVVE